MIAILAFAGGGCVSRGDDDGEPLTRHNVELTETPFYAQSTDQCGPAALTTVLDASGVGVSLSTISERVYVPARGGSLQVELLATARAYQRLPVRIEGDLPAIIAVLNAGKPVLVMQNLGLPFLPVWHYAVVVGYLPETEEFALRSGMEQRRVLSTRRFAQTWRSADYWAIALWGSEEKMSAAIEPEAYLTEAAALESLGQFDVARAAYRQAIQAWPENSIARLGYANSLYGSGDLVAAEAAYRSLLETDLGNLVALNNLAQTLADAGCTQQAMELIDRSSAALKDQSLYPLLMTTRAEIETSRQAASGPTVSGATASGPSSSECAKR